MKLLLGVTGSVATKLTPKIVKFLTDSEIEVQVIATQSSLYFFSPPALRPIRVYKNADEWPNSMYIKDELIQHIELGKWADAILIAPLSANTLAKLANGICDNLLTCILRAWDLEKPVIIAPAMNTRMWNHPATAIHLQRLQSWYRLTIVDPIAKHLACGDTGIGALANIADIIDAVNKLKPKND